MTRARHRTSAPTHRRPAQPLGVRDAVARLTRPGVRTRAGASALLLCLAGGAAVSAPVAAGGAVDLPEVATPLADVALAAPAERAATAEDRAVAEDRAAAVQQVSRDAVRAAPDAAAPVVAAPVLVPETTVVYAVEDTSVLAEPTARGDRLSSLARGAQLAVTGRTERGYSEVAAGAALGWILTADISTSPPPKLSDAPCPGQGSVENGLRASTVAVHRAVCAQFPGLVHGGLRRGDDGDHGIGKALDIMIRGAAGDELARWLQQNADELGIHQLIWRQRIWYSGSSFDAWKGMEDRGSETANHYDHVHVSMH
jgi:hypothetical protein